MGILEVVLYAMQTICTCVYIALHLIKKLGQV